MAKNEVKVSVVGDVAQFNSAINSANDTAKKFISDTTAGTRQMTGVFTNFGYIAQDLPYAFQNFGSIANNINPAINAVMYMNQETGSLGATMAMIAKNMLSPVGLIFLLTSVLPSAIQMTISHFNSLEKSAIKSVDNIANAVSEKIKFTGGETNLTFNVPNEAVALNLELMKSVVKEQERQLELAKALPQSYSDLVILGKQNQAYTKQDFEDNKNKEQSLENQLKYYTAIKDQFQARNDLLEVQAVMERLLVMDMEGLLRASKEYADKPLITKLIGDLVELKKAGKESKELLKIQEEISKIVSSYGRHLEMQQKEDQDRALEAFDDYSSKYAGKLSEIKELELELSGATTAEKIALKKQEISDFTGSELEKLDLIIELKKLELQYETQLKKDKAELSKLQLEHDTKMSGNNLLTQVQLKGQELQNFKGSEEEKLMLKIEYMKLLNELDKQYLAETEKRNRELEINNQKMISNMANQWSSLNRTIWDSTRTGKEKWEMMLNDMLIGLTEAIGQMIIQWALYDSAKSKAQGGTGEFSSSGIISAVLGTIPVVGTFLSPIASALGFANGGYTGDGNPKDIAGFVHKREYVLDADKTSRLDKGFGFIDKAVQAMGSSVGNINIQPIDYNKLALAVTSQPPNVFFDGVDTNKSLDRSRIYDRRRF